MTKINFSHPNAALAANGWQDCQIQASDLTDLAGNTASIASMLLAKFPDLPTAGQITMTLPGASALVVAVITAIHAITGTFPVIVPLVRDDSGAWAPAQAVDMQAVRTQIRVQRTSDDVVIV